jgi:hypothetical protein
LTAPVLSARGSEALEVNLPVSERSLWNLCGKMIKGNGMITVVLLHWASGKPAVSFPSDFRCYDSSSFLRKENAMYGKTDFIALSSELKCALSRATVRGHESLGLCLGGAFAGAGVRRLRNLAILLRLIGAVVIRKCRMLPQP